MRIIIAFLMLCGVAFGATNPTLDGFTLGRDFLGQLDEAVGHAGHGGDDGDDLIAGALRLQNAAGAVADAFWVADGGAAVFLHDKSHAGWGERAAKMARRPRCASPEMPRFTAPR